MLRTQIPLNSPAGRKITAALLAVCILVSLFALSRTREFGRRVESGELVKLEATVQKITVTGRGEDRDYDVWVCYSFRGTDYENVELSWYSSEMEEGQPTTIYVSPDAPGEPESDPATFVRVAIPSILGACLLCFALAWFPRKKADHE